MTYWQAELMGQDSQLFPRTLGEELARMVRRRWPNNTAKHIERTWGVDPKTAKNITCGHVSERVISKAMKAEGWDLLEALGHALTGKTYAEWQEAKLDQIVKEAEQARENVRRLRVRSQTLAEKAAELDGLRDRQGAGEPGNEHGQRRRSSLRVG